MMDLEQWWNMCETMMDRCQYFTHVVSFPHCQVFIWTHIRCFCVFCKQTCNGHAQKLPWSCRAWMLWHVVTCCDSSTHYVLWCHLLLRYLKILILWSSLVWHLTQKSLHCSASVHQRMGCEFNFQDERYEHYFYLCHTYIYIYMYIHILIFYKRISVKMKEILWFTIHFSLTIRFSDSHIA